MALRTVEIPDGPNCLKSNEKPCLFAKYAEHMQAYNCRLYGRLLKGRKKPLKCAECIKCDGGEAE